MSNSILIVDDEPDIRGLLSMTIERMGHKATCAPDVKTAGRLLTDHSFHLCLTDLKLPDGSGIDIVSQIQQDCPQTPVIVITAHGSMDIAIDAMKQGAFDFLNKPVDLNHLRGLITSALNTEQQADLSETDNIIGRSPAAMTLKEKVVKVARSQAPVFISGESGSGKELVARTIHALSSRKDKPFVPVNCGAIPRELMESELFGHIKGSFTGAHQDKQGLFQSAQGGTLFLDEVADLPIDMQVKLLRAIQEKSIRPVGSQKEMAIDVRILSATHKELQQEIHNGDFRNDLYYRINVIDIAVPPLRERIEDISLLSDALLQKIADKNQMAAPSLSAEARDALSTYRFPGNIRELENILERACALCGSDAITATDLQLNKPAFSPAASKVQTKDESENTSGADTNNASASTNYDPDSMSIDEYLDNIEKDIILESLERHRWNRTTTAKRLGITFRSLRYRMKKLGIDDE